MTASFDKGRVELAQSGFLRLANAAGTSLTCLRGALWVTRDGSPKDAILAAGQSYVVEDAARILVFAFEPSLTLVQPPAAPARERPGRTLQGASPRRMRAWISSMRSTMSAMLSTV